MGSRRSPRFISRWLLLAVLLLLLLWVGTGFVSQIVVESLWFSEVGYESAFWVRIGTKAVIWLIVTGLSLLFLLQNLRLANRLKYSRVAFETVEIPGSKARNSRQRSQKSLTVVPSPTSPISPPLPFRWLLPIVISISLALGLLLLQYGQALLDFWQFATSHPGGVPVIPNYFRVETIWQFGTHLATAPNPLPYLGLAGLGAIALLLLLYPQTCLGAIALCLSLGFGFVLAANWGQVLLLLRATPFDRAEPLFQQDIGFYIFLLPIAQLLEFWLVGLFVYALFAVTLLYLVSGNSLSEGFFPGFSPQQERHLYRLGGWLMLTAGFSYWISRYELLYSGQGVLYGAGFTEVRVQLPIYTAMAILAAAIALFLFWQATSGKLISRLWPHRLPLALPLVILGGFLGLAIAATILPVAVQHFIVQPNELTREQPYIRRHIALTREAFNLESIDVQPFNPTSNLTFQDVQANQPTVRNIRLWDTRPLLQTNRQLQQIRPYYRFYDADIDRYTLKAEPPTSSVQPAALESINQQVLISARELDYDAVAAEAKTWVNQHLVYTHGYGFTLSPVNQVAPGGLPEYFVRDIGSDPNNPGENLVTSSPAIRASIPISAPRIYFGEITNTYVMVDTKQKELDYPSGSDNVYNTYDGAGGIGIGPGWKRWLAARYLQDWQMMLTDYFKPQTRLLFRRNITDRVRAIAPFLRYDRDPYLVVADLGCRGLELDCGAEKKNSGATPNYLYWVLDAYTTSDHYPYSAPSQFQASKLQTSKLQTTETGAKGGDRFNYLRNSVKVVIDAYHGSINFYIADPSEPILQSWARIFPNLFKPLSALPEALQKHIRYPVDLFNIQAERLMTYHMTDPQVFYNQEDQWQIPNEIYGNQPQPVEPYFLITHLPTIKGSEEFILLLPFRPRQRTNLIAWLAGRSDGINYGKTLLYVFPKQQLVFGIEQVEARINQDPAISQQISLWNRQGSRVIQGNLLVIPIEQSLLYVEPLYLEAEQNSLPTLVSVVVVFENRIAMAPNLEQAIEAVFQVNQKATPAIVRPIE